MMIIMGNWKNCNDNYVCLINVIIIDVILALSKVKKKYLSKKFGYDINKR